MTRSLWLNPEWPRILAARLAEAERIREARERRTALTVRWRLNKRRQRARVAA